MSGGMLYKLIAYQPQHNTCRMGVNGIGNIVRRLALQSALPYERCSPKFVRQVQDQPEGSFEETRGGI